LALSTGLVRGSRSARTTGVPAGARPRPRAYQPRRTPRGLDTGLRARAAARTPVPRSGKARRAGLHAGAGAAVRRTARRLANHLSRRPRVRTGRGAPGRGDRPACGERGAGAGDRHRLAGALAQLAAPPVPRGTGPPDAPAII